MIEARALFGDLTSRSVSELSAAILPRDGEGTISAWRRSASTE